jgi:hypothetical protein
MHETSGTLSLKIARLQQYLAILQQQQRLSTAYPEYQSNLIQKKMLVEHQLEQLMRNREELQYHVAGTVQKGAVDGECNRQESIYPAN